MIGLVAVTAAGRAGASRLAAAWPGRTRQYPGPAATALPTAYAECEAVVAFLATGAAVRLLAPSLAVGSAAGSGAEPAGGKAAGGKAAGGKAAGGKAAGGKAVDPAVVCVDQAQRYAIALLGGHLAGANQLAREVAVVLEAEPVITTATDAAELPGLDDLGLPVRGDVAGVSRAILDGEPVRLVPERRWPLPAFPPNVTEARPASAVEPVDPAFPVEPVDPAFPVDPAVPVEPVDAVGSGESKLAEILVTDRAVADRPGRVVLHPPTLVIGVGASRGAPSEELSTLVRTVLAGRGLATAAVREIVTVDRKLDEPAVLELAERLGVPVRAFPAAVLATQPAPNPSGIVQAAVGTPSVAEAAVLAAGAELVVPKAASASCTVAVGRRPVRGRLAVVGLGPGARDLITPRAVAELRAASTVVGLRQYLEQVTDLFRPGTVVLASGMGAEAERTRVAVELAQAGQAVALVGSGDAGIYAMASPALETLAGLLASGGPPIDVVGVPGVTAALAAANLLGAPLGNDHAYVSLSDLHTPWDTIERRLAAAAAGDFTVALYNPRSSGRTEHLTRAIKILGSGRPGTTPVGVVRNASRPGERIEVTTLDDLDPATVDMLTVVIVGASDTRVVDGRMVTPRGYRWMA